MGRGASTNHWIWLHNPSQACRNSFSLNFTSYPLTCVGSSDSTVPPGGEVPGLIAAAAAAVMAFQRQINTEDHRFVQLVWIIPHPSNLQRLLEADLRKPPRTGFFWDSLEQNTGACFLMKAKCWHLCWILRKKKLKKTTKPKTLLGKKTIMCRLKGWNGRLRERMARWEPAREHR